MVVSPRFIAVSFKLKAVIHHYKRDPQKDTLVLSGYRRVFRQNKCEGTLSSLFCCKTSVFFQFADLLRGKSCLPPRSRPCVPVLFPAFRQCAPVLRQNTHVLRHYKPAILQNTFVLLHYKAVSVDTSMFSPITRLLRRKTTLCRTKPTMLFANAGL